MATSECYVPLSTNVPRHMETSQLICKAINGLITMSTFLFQNYFDQRHLGNYSLSYLLNSYIFSLKWNDPIFDSQKNTTDLWHVFSKIISSSSQ